MTRSMRFREGAPTKRVGVFGAAVVGMGLLGLFLLQASVVRAGEHDDIMSMVEHAKTKADHEAIAAYYEKQAEAAKNQAELHRKMEKSYAVAPGGGTKGSATSLSQHCAALAKHYESLAQEYTTLAAAHRDMAKSAK